MSVSESVPVVLPVNDRPGTPFWFRLLAALALGWLLLALHGFSNTECDFDLLMLLIFGGLAIGIGWFVATCLALESLRCRRAWVCWLIVPCAGTIGLFLAKTDVGFRCRFSLSETALTERAESLLAGTDPSSFPSRVGLFWVREAHVYEGAVYFYTSQSFINREGLAYSPQPIGSPPRMSVKPISGRWHLFVWRF